jgi:hypothetical protein
VYSHRFRLGVLNGLRAPEASRREPSFQAQTSEIVRQGFFHCLFTRFSVGRFERAVSFGGIPKGAHLEAQGREERATLGDQPEAPHLPRKGFQRHSVCRIKTSWHILAGYRSTGHSSLASRGTRCVVHMDADLMDLEDEYHYALCRPCARTDRGPGGFAMAPSPCLAPAPMGDPPVIVNPGTAVIFYRLHALQSTSTAAYALASR